MKKLFALLLALSLCFAIVGCDNEEETVEVSFLNLSNKTGGIVLSMYDINNEYFVFHCIRIDGTTMDSFNENVGFMSKNDARFTKKVLTNTYVTDIEYRKVMKNCTSLNKADIITLLTTREFDEMNNVGTKGVLILKQHPASYYSIN